MNELSNQNNDLRLMNTPLQNLKNILSDVDATVQSAPEERNASEEKVFLHESTIGGVSKAEIREFVNRLVSDSKQFFSSSVLKNALSDLRPVDEDIAGKVSENFFKNIHITELNRLLK